MAQYLEEDLTAWAQCYWQRADEQEAAAHAALSSRSVDVLDSVYAQHPVVVDRDAPLSHKLAALPWCAHRAACAASLSGPAGQAHLKLNTSDQETCRYVARIMHNVPGLRALALQIPVGSDTPQSVQHADTILAAMPRAQWLRLVPLALVAQGAIHRPLCQCLEPMMKLASARADALVLRKIQPFADPPNRRNKLTASCITCRASASADTLAAFQHIIQLHICDARVSADSMMKLAPQLAQLTQLRNLELSQNAFGPFGAQALAPALPQLQRLEYLRVGDMQLDSACIAVLAPALSALSRLTHLAFENQSKSPLPAHELYEQETEPACLSHLTTLQHLELTAACDLTLCMHELHLGALTALTHLSLDGACFNPPQGAAHWLMSFLEQLVLLQELVLSCSATHLVSGEGLAPVLCTLSELRVLSLAGQQRARQGIEQLAASIAGLSGLQHLNLSNLHLHPDDTACLMQAFTGCALSSHDVDAASAAIEKAEAINTERATMAAVCLTGLTFLDFSGNFWRMRTLAQLALWLPQLQELRDLRLNEMRATGQQPAIYGVLPTFRCLPKLEQLHLEDCELRNSEGAAECLYVCLTGMPALRVLKLRFNHLGHGAVPESLRSVPELDMSEQFAEIDTTRAT